MVNSYLVCLFCLAFPILQVYKEFLEQVKALTIHHLLDQFVRSKGTGKAIPGIIIIIIATHTKEFNKGILNRVLFFGKCNSCMKTLV